MKKPSRCQQKNQKQKKHILANQKSRKHRQLIRMLSFRIVPTYYKKIEKIANSQNTTVSGLIRKYIKEGMVRDLEMKKSDPEFRIE